jgi:hypothetical protein
MYLIALGGLNIACLLVNMRSCIDNIHSPVMLCMGRIALLLLRLGWE